MSSTLLEKNPQSLKCLWGSMMQQVPLIFLSVCLGLGGAACSGGYGTSPVSEPFLTPAQQQTVQNLQFIQRKLYVDYQRKRLAESVWGIRNEAQIQAMKNFKWTRDYMHGRDFLLEKYR